VDQRLSCQLFLPIPSKSKKLDLETLVARRDLPGLPEQGVAIDAIAVSDAATHDGQTLFPHVEKVLGDHPDLAQSVRRVRYDRACDDAPLKRRFQDELRLELKASFNPRRSKAISEALPRRMEGITPPMACPSAWRAMRGTTRVFATPTKYIYRAPQQDDGLSVCIGCRERAQCCHRDTASGRTITVSFYTETRSRTDKMPGHGSVCPRCND
jgi:hypothetical protein